MHAIPHSTELQGDCKAPGLAYFPGISLGLDEAVIVNFGARPLRFPVEGFSPVQPPLVKAQQGVAQAAEYLIGCLMRLSASQDVHTSLSDDSVLCGSASECCL